MNLSMRDWTVSLLFTSFLAMLISNFLGNHISVIESIPGVLILSAIAFAGVFLGKIIPLKLPSIIYVVLLGLLVACPISPISGAVLEYTGKINYVAPIAVVGALAGIGLDFKSFRQQSWKMLIIAILVYTGTFITQAIFAEVFLRVTHQV